MAAKTVIKLTPELGKRLKVEAALRGVTMNSLVSAWIDHHLCIQPPQGLPSAAEVIQMSLAGIPPRKDSPSLRPRPKPTRPRGTPTAKRKG